MADRPMIFSAPMVRALLDGRKTQTRRIFVPPPPFDVGDDITVELATGSIKPKWQIGDRLWVRERWARTSVRPIVATLDEPWVVYDACDNRTDYGGPWRSPIHMSRVASRLTLPVIDVRVQRLQDISREDVIAEGIVDRGGQPIADCVTGWHEPYAALWNSLHGPDAWNANPWVAAITFDVIRANIDALPGTPTDADAGRSRGGV